MTDSENKTRKKAAKSAPKRKRALPIWKDRNALAGAALLVSLGATAGYWHLDRAGWIDQKTNQVTEAVINGFSKLGFRVADVLVVGRDRTEQEALLAALGIERGSPLFGFDPKDARERVEALPWVMTASVERLYPNTVLVQVQERLPLALWQKDGKFSLIDQRGEVIIDQGLESFAHLPVLVGDGAPAHAADLIALLKGEPHLANMVRAAVRVGDRRWNIRLANNIDIRLPENDARGAWKRLADYQKEHRVLERDVRVLDLRLPDRLIVETGAKAKPETLRRISDHKT